MTPAKPKTPEENITQSTGVAPENAETPTDRSRSFTCAAAQERRSATDYRSEWNRRTGAVRQASMVGWAFHPSETARANTENGRNRIESGSNTGHHSLALPVHPLLSSRHLTSEALRA